LTTPTTSPALSAAPTPGSPGPLAQPKPGPLSIHWRLDPALTFLNHGSFGATPKMVQAAQDRWRERLELDPVRFFVQELEPALDTVRRAIAGLMRCRWQDVAMIPNATIAISNILNNIALKPGDDILTSDHEYPASQNAIKAYAARAGGTVTMVRIPFPTKGPDEVYDAIMAGVTPRTRLVLLSHITSPTGLIFPVERLVAELNHRGIDALVDGAHTPGSLDFDAGTLNAPYYFANCHKWLSSPKGSAFMVVREDRQAEFRPMALSVAAHLQRPDRARFLWEFDYVGGVDPTAHLAVPEAIRFPESIIGGGGWPEVYRRNHELCLKGRDAICRWVGVAPPAPDSMIASMSTILLPDPPASLANRPTKYRDALQDALLENHRIQVPIWRLPETGRRAVRISAQLYNTLDQYEYLGWALKTEIDAEHKLAGQ
jgi:isopenicillin-N epimerase